MALFKLIQKNFKLLIRSKSSALIIILGPLLVIFLVGIAFDNMDKFSLNIGAYSSEYSDVSESFIQKLQDKDYEVIKIESEDLCVEQIKMGKLHTCIIFPPGLIIDSSKMNELVFYVDYSKMNLIWMVIDTLSTKVHERSTEISTDLTSNLLNKIEATKSEINTRKSSIDSLKSTNSQISDKIGVFSSSISEFSTASVEMKDYILQKVVAAKAEISVVKSAIDGSNASDSQKSSMSAKISSIDTYLYNINNKIEDPNDLSANDWSNIARLAGDVSSQIASVSDLVSQSSSQIVEVESSLNGILSNLDSIQVSEATTIVNPITTSIKPVVAEKSYLNYMFPSLIILVVMFISILLSTTLVMMDKHSPAYFRNFITPTKTIVFILATYFTNLILVSVQLAIILLISSHFFKAQIVQSLQVMIPGLLLITTLFTFFGMLIGYWFNSEETATLAAISFGSVFLFLSNVILPLESMPAYIRDVAQFNPFVLGESLLRKSIFFSASFKDLVFEFQWLGVYAGVIFILIWVSQKVSRRHFFHKVKLAFTKKKKK